MIDPYKTIKAIATLLKAYVHDDYMLHMGKVIKLLKFTMLQIINNTFKAVCNTMDDDYPVYINIIERVLCFNMQNHNSFSLGTCLHRWLNTFRNI